MPAPKTSDVLLPVIDDLGLPVFVFGIIFLIATLVLMQVLTPDRFPVRIGDRVVRIRDLEAEQQRLEVSKAELLQHTDPVTETSAPVLHQLIRMRSTLLPVGQILLDIEKARSSFQGGSIDPISLPGIEVRESGRKILLQGEVRDPGGRSIQILASFVDGLRATRRVRAVTEPEYEQQISSDGVGVSPFTITITLDDNP